MKILYYFQELATPMFQWQRKHFIDELAHHNIEIETFNPLLYNNVDEANEKVVEKVRKDHYDLFLSNMGYYKMLYVDTVEAIKKFGVPTMRIAWDNLMIPFIDEVLAPHFDLVWLTAKETERLYIKWKVNYFFAPYAANPFVYKYVPTTKINRNVCFIGTPHGSRAVMINGLTKNGIPVHLYYGGKSKKKTTLDDDIYVKYNIINPSRNETLINRLRFKEGRMLIKGSVINRIKGKTKVENNAYLNWHDSLSFDDMVRTYTESILSIASSSAGHTDVLKKPLPIINLRNFEIPMCGGIEICKYSDELADYFEDGREIVLYKDDAELIEKARYYIETASDTEIIRIKEAARKRAESEHSWFCRFKNAFNILGLRND